MLATPELLNPFMSNYLPICNKLPETFKLVLALMSRYMTRACSEDAEHDPNMGNNSPGQSYAGLPLHKPREEL
jgi:hypothetical protein